MVGNMEENRRGPGRPRIQNGRNQTKSFRLDEETLQKLKELMTYYGQLEGKRSLSTGKTIERLINEKWIYIAGSKSRKVRKKATLKPQKRSLRKTRVNGQDFSSFEAFPLGDSALTDDDSDYEY